MLITITTVWVSLENKDPSDPKDPLRPKTWKQRPPPPPYFGGLRNYDQPVASVTEKQNFEATFSVLDWHSRNKFRFKSKNFVFVSIKKLTVVSSKFLTSTKNDLDQKWRLIDPKTVIIHTMSSILSSAMFCAVSTASFYTVGAWQKSLFAWLLEGFVRRK